MAWTDRDISRGSDSYLSSFRSGQILLLRKADQKIDFEPIKSDV
jgi:hypothetical protein